VGLVDFMKYLAVCVVSRFNLSTIMALQCILGNSHDLKLSWNQWAKAASGMKYPQIRDLLYIIWDK